MAFAFLILRKVDPGVVQFERAWRERSEAGSRSSRSLENTALIVSGAESEEVMVKS